MILINKTIYLRRGRETSMLRRGAYRSLSASFFAISLIPLNAAQCIHCMRRLRLRLPGIANVSLPEEGGGAVNTERWLIAVHVETCLPKWKASIQACNGVL